jgi:hypothetical protein
MRLTRTTVAGVAAAATLIGTAVTACGGDNSSSSSSSASSSTTATSTSTTSAAPSPSAPAQPADYSSLLIKPTDIGPDITTPGAPITTPPETNPQGVVQKFSNPDGSRQIFAGIKVFPDPAAAAQEIESTKAATVNSEVVGTPQPADVGSNGVIIAGKSPDNSKARTVVLFTEGRAAVNIEFESAPNDPVTPEVALDIARKQDTAIKNGLPG